MLRLATAILAVMLFPALAFGQTAPDKAFEDRVSLVLSEKLNLASTVQTIDQASADTAVRTLINGDPQVVLLGNARVVGQLDDGSPSQLAFNIILLPDANTTVAAANVREFANRWNGQQIPLKVIAQNNSVAVVVSRLIDLKYPMADDEIVGMYVFIMQTWPRILADLRKSNIF